VYWKRVRIYPMNICESKRFHQRLTLLTPTATGMQRSFELITKLLIRIFKSYFLPFQLWNRIVRAGHWPTCLRQEHPFLRDQIENSGQKDLRDVKAGQICVALYQPLMHLGWLRASSKAK
jgi:hypothetical protein